MGGRAMGTEDMTDRHKSQVNILNRVEEIRQAVLSLPTTARISSTCDDTTIFLDDMEYFNRKFRGFECKIENERLYVKCGGVTFASPRIAPKPPTVGTVEELAWRQGDENV